MKEYNKDALQKALGALPVYEAPDDLWTGISTALDAEEKLAALTKRLPLLQAPAEIWSALEASLDAEAALAAEVAALPVYEAPDTVWPHIAAQLPQEQPNWTIQTPKAAIVEDPVPLGKHNPWKVFRKSALWGRGAFAYAVAAAMLCLLAAVVFMRPIGAPTNEVGQISIKQETLDGQLAALWMESNQEDDAFEMVQHLCQAQAPVCEAPEFKNLKTELDELTEAKNTLRHAMGQYADDPELASQMADIERERSAILRELVELALQG